MRSVSELEQMLAQSAVVNRIAFFDPSTFGYSPQVEPGRQIFHSLESFMDC